VRGRPGPHRVSLSFLNVRRIGTLQERRRFGSLPFGNPGSAPLAELLIDRGYLGSPRIGDLHAHGWRFGPRRGRVPTGAGSRSRRLRFGWLRPRVLCPAHQTARIVPGATTVHFAAAVCQTPAISARRAPPASGRGRSIAIHPQEALAERTPAAAAGRGPASVSARRSNTRSRVDHIQGPKARYKGIHKNTLDVRRVAVIVNLQRIARLAHAA
jgi:hypothetical protein